MSTSNHERFAEQRLARLAELLRDATWAAFSRQSLLAEALDESRCEVERLLMLGVIHASEFRRVALRAQMMLDAWYGMAAPSAARAR